MGRLPPSTELDLKGSLSSNALAYYAKELLLPPKLFTTSGLRLAFAKLFTKIIRNDRKIIAKVW